jgi:hypothetical protein
MGDSHDGSVVVEVKTSRSDFLADFKKPHRSGDTVGIGMYRYYMCPEGVIRPDELPERWGLLYVNNRGHVKHLAGAVTCERVYNCFVALENWQHPVDHSREQFIIVRLLSRLGDVENIHNQLKELWRENHDLRQRLDQATKRRLQTADARVSRLNVHISDLENTLRLFGVEL